MEGSLVLEDGTVARGPFFAARRRILGGLVFNTNMTGYTEAHSYAEVVRVPYDTTSDEILSLKPDGVILSNGPGDPPTRTSWRPPSKRAGSSRDASLSWASASGTSFWPSPSAGRRSS